MRFSTRFSVVVFSYAILVAVEFADAQLVPDALYSRGCLGSRGQFPHEAYCHKYYNCWDGRATIEECPGELLFNAVTSVCDYPEAVSCGGRIRNLAPFIAGGTCLKHWGTFPDPTDCTAFYECDHGIAFRKVCPFYTAFDERVLVCVHAHEVDCAGRGGVYGTLAPPIYPLPDSSSRIRIQDDRNRVGTSGTGSFVRRPGSTTSSSVGPEKQYERPLSTDATFRCPHPRGLYAFALDCTKFWLCREYRPSLLKCPMGQLFDLASLTCTQPEKAQCSSLSPRS